MMVTCIIAEPWAIFLPVRCWSAGAGDIVRCGHLVNVIRHDPVTGHVPQSSFKVIDSTIQHEFPFLVYALKIETAILMIVLLGKWNEVEPVLLVAISKELEGPVPPGPGGRGHNENCWIEKMFPYGIDRFSHSTHAHLECCIVLVRFSTIETGTIINDSRLK